MDKDWLLLFVGAGLSFVGFTLQKLYSNVKAKEIAVLNGEIKELKDRIEDLRKRLRDQEIESIKNLALYNVGITKVNEEIHDMYEKMLEKLLFLKNEGK